MLSDQNVSGLDQLVLNLDLNLAENIWVILIFEECKNRKRYDYTK